MKWCVLILSPADVFREQCTDFDSSAGCPQRAVPTKCIAQIRTGQDKTQGGQEKQPAEDCGTVWGRVRQDIKRNIERTDGRTSDDTNGFDGGRHNR